MTRKLTEPAIYNHIILGKGKQRLVVDSWLTSVTYNDSYDCAYPGKVEKSSSTFPDESAAAKRSGIFSRPHRDNNVSLPWGRQETTCFVQQYLDVYLWVWYMLCHNIGTEFSMDTMFPIHVVRGEPGIASDTPVHREPSLIDLDLWVAILLFYLFYIHR